MALANAASAIVSSVLPSSEGKLARTFRARHHVLERWKEKCAAVRDVNRQLVWFHAPSVGEGLQARPVIDLLRAKRPDIQIAYSFFSPSAEKFAKSLNVDVAEYLPFDSVNAAQGMIDVLSPTALFFSKLDVWPNLVRVAATRGVKTGLLSGTVAPKSGRQGVLARALLHDAYHALDIVGAIDADNAWRLAALGVRNDRLSVSGDTRFDQVWARAQTVDRNSSLLRSLHATRPTLVAGSTWPADEAVLLPAWLDVRKRVSDARIIIAPHEPTSRHIDPIVGWARANGLSVTTLSSLSADGNDNARDVLVIDRVGVLGDIYAIANVAFVGGAFHKAGLHSVIEPAAYGLPVVFGPAYNMSREAALLLEHGAARSVNSREQCAAALQSFFESDTERVRAGRSASVFVKSELGAAERSLLLIQTSLTIDQ